MKFFKFFIEDRSLSSVDFDYAFDEFKPISVKLLEDQTKKNNRMALHWSDIGGMTELKQELIQTIQWRFEVNNDLLSITHPLPLAFELFHQRTDSISLRCTSLRSIGLWKDFNSSNISQ